MNSFQFHVIIWRSICRISWQTVQGISTPAMFPIPVLLQEHPLIWRLFTWASDQSVTTRVGLKVSCQNTSNSVNSKFYRLKSDFWIMLSRLVSLKTFERYKSVRKIWDQISPGLHQAIRHAVWSPYYGHHNLLFIKLARWEEQVW